MDGALALFLGGGGTGRAGVGVWSASARVTTTPTARTGQAGSDTPDGPGGQVGGEICRAGICEHTVRRCLDAPAGSWDGTINGLYGLPAGTDICLTDGVSAAALITIERVPDVVARTISAVHPLDAGGLRSRRHGGAAMIELARIEAAAGLIADHLVRTPTVPSPGLSDLLGVPVTVKLELLQRTGSFKARGATAKLLSLDDAQRAAGVVAVSGGNHAIAVAVMARALDVKATVVMPRSAPARAAEICTAAGATLRLTDDMSAAFALMDQLRADGLTLVHPFDDPVVVAGQGTVGLELADDAPELTDVLVSIGGGALISGVAAALRARRPQVRIWGVETVGAQAMSRARAAGGPVPVELSSIVLTLSAPMVSALTYDHVTELVSEVLVVSDAEAVRGTLELAEHGKVWAEPAAGCLLPAARQVIDRVGPQTRIGLVVCGGNSTVADVTGWAARFDLR
ncbi:threonine/serine dehydratase [Solwaraspora sp. WMMD406]|uniref:threonine/serine dehydratase n=1 Tax=Solwaraspora sp. WMMD406 TaxID=3016095 RepID=UPI0024175F18|nr:threonine/serine dehydratase [Solwaraspora sp. WMMD406]MDG4766176.1 threonine/serine dehydratase [Solwaraspora sp. WMMD406]